MSQRDKQRSRLFQINPNCHWCGERTALPSYSKLECPTEPHHATIDHLNSRLSPARHTPTSDPYELRHVLSCYKCNQERAREELIQSGRSVLLKEKPIDDLIRILELMNRKPLKQKKHHPQLKAIQCEVAWRQFGMGWEYLLD